MAWKACNRVRCPPGQGPTERASSVAALSLLEAGMKRREFVKGSAALIGAAAIGPLNSTARAAEKLEVPTIDKLTIRVLIDSSHDLFMRPISVNGVSHQPPGLGKGSDFKKILHNQWGLSLYLQSERAAEQRSMMLDFGYSPDALINNIEITRVDP